MSELNNRPIGSNTTLQFNEDDAQLAVIPVTGKGEVTEPIKPSVPEVDITKPMGFAEIMSEFPGSISALRKLYG